MDDEEHSENNGLPHRVAVDEGRYELVMPPGCARIDIFRHGELWHRIDEFDDVPQSASTAVRALREAARDLDAARVVIAEVRRHHEAGDLHVDLVRAIRHHDMLTGDRELPSSWAALPSPPPGSAPAASDDISGDISDDEIRHLHNNCIDDPATDALCMYFCHVALGECCIATEVDTPRSRSAPLRYPSVEERVDARRRLAEIRQIRAGADAGRAGDRRAAVAESGRIRLDDDEHVYFYEQELYVLSNFSAFRLDWQGCSFDTSEAAYHWCKFPGQAEVRNQLIEAASAHDAFQIARRHQSLARSDWNDVRVDVMRHILLAKARQHEYVRRKLLETGSRRLVENSWRDDFWGWGADRRGKNMLGRLWMEIREKLRADVRLVNEAKPTIEAP